MGTVANLDLVAGTRVGRYLVTRRVEAGAMGVVYEAFDPELERRVALEVLRPELLERRKSVRERLLREAQALAMVEHPNVVRVFDVGPVRNSLFIAMEFVAGRTGREWLRDNPPWRRVLEVFTDAGHGLAAIHAAGLVRAGRRQRWAIARAAAGAAIVTGAFAWAGGFSSSGLGRHAEALAEFERAYDLFATSLGEGHRATAAALSDIGTAQQLLRRWDDARRSNERALVMLEATSEPPVTLFAKNLGNLGFLSHRAGGAGPGAGRAVAGADPPGPTRDTRSVRARTAADRPGRRRARPRAPKRGSRAAGAGAGRAAGDRCPARGSGGGRAPARPRRRGRLSERPKKLSRS